MSRRKLLKLKWELDMLELDVQLWGLKYHPLLVKEAREVGQPVATNEVGTNLEGDEVKFDLPSRFEELEEEGRREEKELVLNELMEEVEEEEGGEEKEVFLNEPIVEVEEGPDEGELLVIREFDHKEITLISPETPTHVQDGFLSKGSQLYIPKCGFRELFIHEVHGGAITGPFGEPKMSMLKEHYYRPTLSRDVEYYIKGFKRKSKVQSILDENEDIPSLRTNSHQPGEYDGDHPPIAYTIMKEDGGDSKNAEEVQIMVRNELKQSNSALGTSPGNWPGLGTSFEPSREGIISCTPLPIKA